MYENIKLRRESVGNIGIWALNQHGWRKFRFTMSEMHRNAVNCHKSDFPPGRNQKI